MSYLKNACKRDPMEESSKISVAPCLKACRDKYQCLLYMEEKQYDHRSCSLQMSIPMECKMHGALHLV